MDRSISHPDDDLTVAFAGFHEVMGRGHIRKWVFMTYNRVDVMFLYKAEQFSGHAGE